MKRSLFFYMVLFVIILIGLPDIFVPVFYMFGFPLLLLLMLFPVYVTSIKKLT